MVFKFNQTKFNKFSDKIYKISKKYNNDEKYKREILMATLIVNFSSTHSWKTNRELDNGFTVINNKDIMQEYEEAKQQKWKNVSVNDIKELVNKNISDCVFFRWLNNYVEPEKRNGYREAWADLKKNIFEENCD